MPVQDSDYFMERMAEISTPADANSSRTRDSSFWAKRRAMPQSLENSRGVGISLLDICSLRRTFSARRAEELVWNKTTL